MGDNALFSCALFIVCSNLKGCQKLLVLFKSLFVNFTYARNDITEVIDIIIKEARNVSDEMKK